MHLIGVDKECEDAATSRLMPPQKALPAPPVKTVSPSRGNAPQWNASPDLDDDIPF
jgi:hypothetical protein